MVTAAPAPAPSRARAASAIPPARGCATCGRRDAWHKLRSGGWSCRRCEGLPRTIDDPGDPAVLRHQCDKLGCHLAGDGEEEEDQGDPNAIAPAPAAPAATIAVSGPSLLVCPGCRRWARVLSVATDGRLWCGRCPGVP